jgi:hypothetical protein
MPSNERILSANSKQPSESAIEEPILQTFCPIRASKHMAKAVTMLNITSKQINVSYILGNR